MLNLTTTLEPFRAQIEQTSQPTVRFQVSPDSISIATQSKLGGAPYQAEGQEWPLGTLGQPLQFLAQINFAETPALDGFPSRGLLQFFIGTDSLMGLNFDDQVSQTDFRVVFHPEVSGSGTTFANVPKVEYQAVDQESGLVFSTDKEPITHGDFRFQNTLGKGFFDQFGDRKWEVIGEYDEANRGGGHKLGGYPFFTQEDPRFSKHQDFDTLLLQIDSDEEAGIQWGDMGVCNFFIRSTDLQQLDFSNVLYNWDCY